MLTFQEFRDKINIPVNPVFYNIIKLLVLFQKTYVFFYI